jgi:hypothetical protein
VEKQAHTALKNRGFHHGKEFFRAQLSVCVWVVEDSIHEITGATSPDLIGLARQRAELQRKERERAAERATYEAAQKQRLRAELEGENAIIAKNREIWIHNSLSQKKASPGSVVSPYFCA